MGAPRECEHDPVGCETCRYTRKLASSIAWKLANAAKNKAITDKWFEDNKEHRQEYTKEYYLLNAEHLKVYATAYRTQFPEVRLKHRGAIFPPGLNKAKWLKLHGEVCKICHRGPLPKNPICVDHDHRKIGVPNVREPLHRNCNSAFGLYEENPLWLRSAANYAEKHQGLLGGAEIEHDTWDWSSAFHTVLQ